jgi:hypothetical protein
VETQTETATITTRIQMMTKAALMLMMIDESLI